MRQFMSLIAAAGLATSMCGYAGAATMAFDAASDVAYDSGSPVWSVGDNGGTGFQAWSNIGNAVGGGSGGGFIGSGTSIDTSGEAFGIFGNGGGVGEAIRSLTGTLSVGQRFAIDMDNGGIDNGGTVGFGLQNAAGNNLFEFFFVGGQSSYTVSAANVSGTTPGFTSDGLSLEFELTDADSFSFTIDALSNGGGVDHTLTGDLFANADQNIARFRLFNANGGPDVFFNSVSVVPEPTVPLLAGLGASVLLGLSRGSRSNVVA